MFLLKLGSSNSWYTYCKTCVSNKIMFGNIILQPYPTKVVHNRKAVVTDRFLVD